MLVGYGDLALSDSSAKDKKPDFEITLTFFKIDEKGNEIYFDKGTTPKYDYGKPIGAKVNVINKSETLFSKPINSINFALKMLIKNPKGRNLFSKNAGFHDEFPDSPPLPFKRVGKKYVQVIPCDIFETGEIGRDYIVEDLRKYYGIGIPGEHIAQVRVSIMTFKGEPCDVKNPDWAGVLTSDPVGFYIRKPSVKKYSKKQMTHDYRTRKEDAQVQFERYPNKDRFVSSDLLSRKKRSWMYSLQKVLKALVTFMDAAPAFASSHQYPTIQHLYGEPNEAIRQDLPPNEVITFTLYDANPTTIELQVEGELVTTASVLQKGRNEYEVTYRNPDPNGYFHCQLVNVDVSAFYKRGKHPREKFFRFSFRIERPDVTEDQDRDCILDTDEDSILMTDKTKRTLFIRPMIWNTTSGQYDPWVELTNPSHSEYQLNKQPFADADIDLVIIGDQGNLYTPFKDPNYDPSDPEKNKDNLGIPIDFDPSRPGWQGPPCDILKIKARPDNHSQYNRWFNINYGNTWFNKTSGDTEWSWDTKGYVPWSEDWYWEETGYFTPEIYLYAINSYFRQSAYTNVDINSTPHDPPPRPQNCDSTSVMEGCWDFTQPRSPLNANDTSSNPRDGKVAFNQMEFDVDGTITTDPVFASTLDRYNYKQVRDNVLTHEIGHAVIGGSPNQGHCSTPGCIMFGYTTDWETKTFIGDHKLEIVEGIHNSVHQP